MACILFVFCAATTIASPAQILTTLHSFDGTDGSLPAAGLVQASDGNLYGTTQFGGANCAPYGCGTVLKITPSGTLTTLLSFDGADGGDPVAGLVQASDGNFYGTTYLGGANDAGTVFKITPSGTLTTLYSFCSQPNCTDGENPAAGLVQASDGNFYGTTYLGGANGDGTVFKITPSGTLTTLYNFCAQGGCADGAYPVAGLVQGTDGNFYGTTGLGGADGDGTVFKITRSGTLTTLHSFDGNDGVEPFAGLVQGTDGNLYGTTEFGGANGDGTVFKITPSGTLTTPYNFCSQSGCADGEIPVAGLVQASDGNFYGTTKFGGANGNGTVFKLSVGITLSPVQFVPVTPCRLADTRPQNGGGGPIQGGTFQFFNLPALAELGKNCPAFSLASATAYSLNVTVVPQGALGYLTIWPAGRPQPLVSTLNSYDGRVKAVAAIVPGGASEAVSVYVSNTTDVILDIDGYFTAPSQQTLQFYPLPQCRVADTRDSTTDCASGLGAPYLMGNMERKFPVLNAAMNKVPCVIPNSAQAYSMNFTAVPHGSLGYLTVWPTGENQPAVSTLNSYGGQVTANAAIVSAGKGGDISAFVTNDTDLLIDINGYFAAPGQNGLSLYPVVPCRVIDTRTGNGLFNGTLSPPVDPVNSPCAVPAASQADVFNATVVPQGSLGYLTLWPYGGQQPIVSTLNAYDGAVTSNMAIVPAGQNGKVEAFANGTTDLILDISSYFAP
jgi:uncharacterized repeat protein (TIGR03803 family)